MTSLYKGGNRKAACRYPRCQVRRDLHIIGTDICLLLIAIVNIESLCSMKICESICRETFHAVYYFLLFLAWVKKFSLFSISQCWQVCISKINSCPRKVQCLQMLQYEILF